MPNILIASSKAPKGDGVLFLHRLRDAVAADGVVVLGGIVTDGPGCVNYAFNIQPFEDIENFANRLCMALMPSKWSYTEDEIAVDTWVDERQPREKPPAQG